MKNQFAISALTLTALFSGLSPAYSLSNQKIQILEGGVKLQAPTSENHNSAQTCKLDSGKAVNAYLAQTGEFSQPGTFQSKPVRTKPVQNQPTQFRAPKTELKVTGGKAQLASPSRSGLALKTLPGVKQITFRRWSELQKVPDTGLFLVETPFVPRALKSQLKEMNYTLKSDGTLLDEKGEKITLFVKSEVFDIQKKSSAKPKNYQASLQLVAPPDSNLQAANPYPFSQYSWSMYWRYRGGFCRDYRAWTKAEAWGPLQSGYRPHTRIQYIETRAEIGSRKDRDSCFNCDNESSYARWDIGCFWPAHGGASGFHYANWKDGGFSATRVWGW